MSCPICETTFPEPAPTICSQCGWDLKNDLTLCPSMDIPDDVLESYKNRVVIARRNWRERVDAIMRQHETEAELKREKQRRLDEEQRWQEEQNRLEANRRELENERKKLQVEEDRKRKEAEKTSRQENLGQSTLVEHVRMTNEKDGTQLVLIPEGEFLAGGLGKDHGGDLPFPVRLPAYYLALYPVTNAQYAHFLSLVRPFESRLKIGDYLPIMPGWIELGEGCFIRKAGRRYEAYDEKNDHPVVNVSWHGAKAYAKWAGLRLPSELEWEKGARGVDGRKYPWGNTWDESKCQISENWMYRKTNSVQNYPDGRSPWGLYQMYGNVNEWCEDMYDRYAYDRYRQGILDLPSRNGDRKGLNLRGRVLRGGPGSLREDSPYTFRCRDYGNLEGESRIFGRRLSFSGFRLAKSVSF